MEIMQLAQNSQQLIEDFFRQYLGDPEFELPKIYFFAGKFSSLLSNILKIQGITIGHRIILSPQMIFITKSEKKIVSKDLIVHEIAHVLQYRREGFFQFLFNYFRNYLKNMQKKRDWSAISRLEAYHEISYEIEARKVAAEFVKWCQKN